MSNFPILKISRHRGKKKKKSRKCDGFSNLKSDFDAKKKKKCGRKKFKFKL